MEGPLAIFCIFIGMPWVVFHYVTQWKRARGLTIEDERLLDDMHETARRLAERLQTVERILAADNPEFRPQIGRDPAPIHEDDELAEIQRRYKDRAAR